MTPREKIRPTLHATVAYFATDIHFAALKLTPNNIIMICLYVDDLLIIGSHPSKLESLKTQMKKEFEMTNLGRLSYILGMEFVNQREKGHTSTEICEGIVGKV